MMCFTPPLARSTNLQQLRAPVADVAQSHIGPFGQAARDSERDEPKSRRTPNSSALAPDPASQPAHAAPPSHKHTISGQFQMEARGHSRSAAGRGALFCPYSGRLEVAATSSRVGWGALWRPRDRGRGRGRVRGRRDRREGHQDLRLAVLVRDGVRRAEVSKGVRCQAKDPTTEEDDGRPAFTPEAAGLRGRPAKRIKCSELGQRAVVCENDGVEMGEIRIGQSGSRALKDADGDVV
jgi:hypothetical protein